MKVNIGPYRPIKGQKVDIHIDKWDTWSMDHTLAHIIVPMLKQLKATKHGIPNEFVIEGEPWEDSEARWDSVLDKMIWAFEQIIRDDDSMFYESSNKEAYTNYNRQIQEGLDFFGKYYRSLWD